jgi:pimeloyl-ACP methyl ester carboxylesterase
MPGITNHGVRIHYEVSGQGRPLVLLHGWLCDHSWWAESGYLDELGRDHRLVNVDLRGHGASDKPHEPSAYRRELLVGDVLTVADAEGFDRFAIWGLSYGGWIGWLTAREAPERVSALVSTGSWDPAPDTPESSAAYDKDVLEPLRQGGVEALVALFEDESFKFSPILRDVWLRNDPLAVLACQSPELFEVGISNLDDFPVPVLLISGEREDEDDGAAAVAAKVPHGQSLRLPGLGHGAACRASELTIPAARAFFDEWFS